MCIYYYVYLFLCLVVGQGPLFSQNSNPQWNEQWKKEDAQLLHTIQSELKPLLDQHISQSQFDDEYVQKSANGNSEILLISPKFFDITIAR